MLAYASVLSAAAIASAVLPPAALLAIAEGKSYLS